jgi:hypothetical protein
VVRAGLRRAAAGLRRAAAGLRRVAVAPRRAAAGVRRARAAQLRTVHLNPAAIGAAGLRSTMMPVALLATSARTESILVSQAPA